jgi:hypothetical protein
VELTVDALQLLDGEEASLSGGADQAAMCWPFTCWFSDDPVPSPTTTTDY